MSELKCPFCQQELEVMTGLSKAVLGCPKCKHIATIGVWEELIRVKKQVDIAYSGLLGIPEADNSYIKDVTAEDTIEAMRKVR